MMWFRKKPSYADLEKAAEARRAIREMAKARWDHFESQIKTFKPDHVIKEWRNGETP